MHQLDLFRNTWSMHRLWTCESRSPLSSGYQDFWEVAEVNQPPTLESLLLHLERTQTPIDSMGLDSAVFKI